MTATIYNRPMAGAPPELLDRVPIFSGLDPRQREEIAGSMKGRLLAAGDTIAVEGEKGVGFFVIESGTAEVSVGGEARRKLGPGDYFGEIALLSQAARSATVTAETPRPVLGAHELGVSPDRPAERLGGMEPARVTREDAQRPLKLDPTPEP